MPGPSLDRRRLLADGAGLGAAALAAGPATGQGRAKPAVIASANGNTHKNGGDLTCVTLAFQQLISGRDVLDAVITGVNIVELDPADDSVGYGGLPNADGVVQLDAAVMHGALRRAGSVACLEGVRTPSLVARAVMDQTDHHLLVGRDAQAFARRLGFKVEDDLNTENSRRKWLEWKRRTDPLHFLEPDRRESAMTAIRRELVREGVLREEGLYGTIHCSALDPRGNLACVTTTSGLAFKIPGRVGDSPILGAGLYVDNEAGSAGSTGRGEANLYGLSSFLIVEELRRGRHPKDAGMEALRRVRANTREKRLLATDGGPNFDLVFYVVDRSGRTAGVSLRPGRKYALCDEGGPRSLDCDSLLSRSAD